MKLMITCKEATRYISMKEERKLTPRQRFGLWLHLGVCSFCKLFMKQNKIIASVSKHIHEENETLTTAEKEKIVVAINSLP